VSALFYFLIDAQHANFRKFTAIKLFAKVSFDENLTHSSRLNGLLDRT